MNRRFTRFLQVSIAGLDFLTLNLAILLIHSVLSAKTSVESFTSYFRFWLFLNMSWLALSWISAIYDEHHLISFEIFSRKTFRVYFTWLVLALVYLFFTRDMAISRVFIILTISLCGLLFFINRLIYLLIRHYFRKGQHLSKKVLILGYNPLSKKLADYLERESLNTKIFGFCEDGHKVTELSHYPILSNIRNAMQLSKQMHINEIYSTIGPEQETIIYDLMRQADQACIRFHIIPDLSLFIKKPIHINYISDIPILSTRSEPLDDVSSRGHKRIFDIIISSLVIVFILSWMVPLLGFFIWLESKGSVFFIQKRTGRDNHPFSCIKFRSMKINSDADIRQANRNDDRLTRIGRFLRRTNLDEFPQFLNVFKGEMSVVGPRPHMLRHTEDFSKMMDQYMVRQFLKPGVTGWAQVNGFRGEIKDKEQLRGRIERDIWYMENWNIWLDIHIIAKTIYRMIKGDQNAF
jgi:putative colanic acid biosysnthesis UDP-glucose lipid carrier transferase